MKLRLLSFDETFVNINVQITIESSFKFHTLLVHDSLCFLCILPDEKVGLIRVIHRRNVLGVDDLAGTNVRNVSTQEDKLGLGTRRLCRPFPSCSTARLSLSPCLLLSLSLSVCICLCLSLGRSRRRSRRRSINISINIRVVIRGPGNRGRVRVRSIYKSRGVTIIESFPNRTYTLKTETT